ncbi:MAG: DUF192 domain-containing protein [Acidobacteria bacterium]|nr:DUF192 domain-containing protein [Acidobacteriota bacterium]
MLFIHGSPGRYPYWMYNVKVPLDIIWLGLDRRIVEISANTPPCRETSAKNCPNYGGQEEAAYVLELPAGSAARHGLRRGDRLNF